MNPWLTGFPWAGTTDYPAGTDPWAGTPTCVLPTYTYFTPGLTAAPTAQELNYMFNQRDQAIAYNAAAVGIEAVIEDRTGTADGGWGTLYFNAAWTGAGYVPADAEGLASTVVATVVGDVIEVTFSSSVQMTCGLSGATIATSVAIGYAANGLTFTNFVGGEASRQKVYSATEEDIAPITLIGRHIIGAGEAGTFVVGVNGCVPVGLADVGNWGLATAWSVRIRHLRPNP